VWLADDALAQRQVAIKLLPASAEGLDQLRREYALLARLLHPGLPRVYELTAAPALVFELIEGRPLDRWWDGRALTEVVGALAQLLGILDFLHNRGVLHRDVKPDNVLVTDQGVVRLVDLGLALPAGDPDKLGGTAGYIAPEVLAVESPPSRRSDLYAVGVLLFQAIWGRMPFEGKVGQMVAQQMSGEAVLPSEGGSDGLRALLRQLLARKAQRRPASAAEALGLLEELEPQVVSSADRALVGQGLPAPTLVGREELLHPLICAMDALVQPSPGARAERAGQTLSARRGASPGERAERAGQTPSAEPAPRGFVLAGPAGSGRTRICEELVCLAGLRGMQVQRELRWSPGQQKGAVEPPAEGARAVQAAVDRVYEAAARGPLLLMLDQLGHPMEARVLQALHRLAEDELLPLLICVCTDAPPAELADLRRLELTLLDETGVARLVASMLPTRWSSGELAARVHRLSGGSPLLAVELTRLAVARQLDRERPGTDLVAALEGLEVQGRGAALVAARLAGLGRQPHRLAALTALFDRGLPLAGLDPDERGTLDQLVQAGLVTEREDGRIQLSAASLGAPLLRELEPQVRRELSRRACQILELEGEPSAGERASLLWHCGLASEHPGLMLEGARDARASLDLPRAIRLYRAVLEQGPDADATLELATLLQAAGQLDQAVGLLRGAMEARGGRAEQTTAAAGDSSALRHALADAQLRAGDPEGGLRTLGQAAGGSRDSVLRGKLLLFAGRHAEALQAASPLCEGAEAMEALQTVGLARYYLGQLEEARVALEQALQLARQREDRLVEARVANSLALVYQRRGDLDQARTCYARCVALARALSHLPFLATFEMNLGSVAQQQGDHAGALTCYTRSLEVARRFGGLREVAQVTHNLGRLLALLGQWERGRAQIGRSLQLARTLGWRALEAHNLVVDAEIDLLQRGEPEQENLLRAAEIFNELGELAGWAEAQLALARGQLPSDAGEAARIASRAQQRVEGMPTQQIQAALILGRAEPTPARAQVHLRLALRLAEESQEREALVEAHHYLALALHALGDGPGAALHHEAARGLLQHQLEQLPDGLQDSFLEVGPRREVLLGGPGGRADTAQGKGAEIDVELLTALLQINKELAAETDFTRLLERIIDHAVELSGAERGFLLLLEAAAPPGAGEEQPLQIEVARNIDQETIRRREFKISRSVAEEVLQTGKPLITVNAMDDSRFQDFLSVHNLRLRSILCVPMTVRRVVRGAIYVDNRFQDRAFTSTHSSLLSALADQAALAIGNRERMEQLQQQGEELRSSQQELERVNQQLEEAMERQRRELAELSHLTRSQRGELEGRYQFDNLVGQSAAMRELFHLMDRVKDSDAPVYIHGESGTGKELVAKALHYNSARREGPFVSVNCGAIAATLLESELFGYEKGAFTGADRRHRGLLERSHGGSLFLDEVGDMPAELQVKLLRVLQEKMFQAVGGEQEQAADFRLLAASNKDLAELVRAGSFREDLYYRINVIQLRLPPLRQRREDIPLLVEHLLSRHRGGERELSRATLQLLVDHDWPGNVRELENELLRALALGGATIGPQDLSPRLLEGGRSHRYHPSTDAPVATLKEATAQLERTMALEALQRSKGNVTEAARQLAMTRVGLHKLMTRLGIRREDVS